MSLSKKSRFSLDFFKETIFAQIVLLVIVILIVWFFHWSFIEDNTNRENLLGTASLLIDTKGDQRLFSGEVDEGMTMIDALTTSSKAGDFKFVYLVSATGDVTISDINGFSTEDTDVTFFLNDQQIPAVDLGREFLSGGDEIKVFIK